MLRLLSIAVIIGTVVGLTACCVQTVANGYLHYGLYRTIALTLRTCMNTWIIFSVAASVFFATMLTLFPRIKKLVILSCFVTVVLWSGWVMNHYWLPERFHWISLLADVGLLLFSIPLGYVLLKAPWAKFLKNEQRRPSRMALALLATLLLFNLAVELDARLRTSTGPSIILISIDTLRADRLSCYGYDRLTTPNIDSLCEKSVVFSSSITPRPKTTPAMVSVLTSLYPHTHDVRTLYKPLDGQFLTLQEILLEEKYKTAAFVGNWVLQKQFSGLSQGFQEYDDDLPDREPNRNVFERKAPEINKALFNWLDDNHRSEFFVWVHYQDVHGPYIAPEKYREGFHTRDEELHRTSEVAIPDYQRLEWIESQRLDGHVDVNLYRDAYDAEIKFADEHLGQLLQKLRELELDDLVVIVTADHGESLGEHDYYFEHGEYVYDQTSKVPLLFHGPGIIGPRTVEQQVSTMDIMPTVLDILGYPIPSHIEGRSLRPLLYDKETNLAEAPIFIEKENDIKAVRTSEWKYIRNFDSGTEELYNLRQDPRETDNVVSEHAEVRNDLRDVLSRWMNEKDSINVDRLQDMKLGEEDIEALKALGYVQ